MTKALAVAPAVTVAGSAASALTIHRSGDGDVSVVSRKGNVFECQTTAAGCNQLYRNRKMLQKRGTWGWKFKNHFKLVEPIALQAEAPEPSVPGVVERTGGETGGSETYVGGDNGLASTPSPVPLPAAGWMLLAGVGGLVAMRRRNRG